MVTNHMHPKPDRRPIRMALLSALFVLALSLAGCAGMDLGSDEDPSKGPVAELETSDSEAFSGEPITFDATGSNDPNGEIVTWLFDFGDGNVIEVKDEEQARQRYTYQEGGQYTFVLTVIDDGEEQEEPLRDQTTKEIVINDREEVAGQVLEVGLGDENDSSEMEVPIEVFQGASEFELDLNLTSSSVVGASEIQVEVVDPDGNVLDEHTVTIDSGETEGMNLNGLLLADDDHSVRVTAMSGGATFEGTFYIYAEPGEHSSEEDPGDDS